MFKLTAFLLLGAIFNVAVAWAAALWANRGTIDPLFFDHRTIGVSHDQVPCWYVMRFERRTSTRINLSYRDPGDRPDSGWPDTRVDVPSWSHGAQLPEAHERWNKYIEIAQGWPTRSVMGRKAWLRNQPPDWFASETPHRITGLKLTKPFKNNLQVELAYQPIWPGFVINSIFYAAILWLPFAAIGAFRRRRRIKRGLCPSCGYDLRASKNKLCPECGAITSMPS